MSSWRSLAVAGFAALAASASLGAQAGTLASGRRQAVALDSAGLERMRMHEREVAKLRREAPASFDSLRSYFGLTVQMQLARLGYGSGPFDIGVSDSLQALIRAYEADRGLPPTGDPLSFRLTEALRDDEAFFATAPSLPGKTVVSGSGWLRATGAWMFPEMGDQSMAVEISCDRARQLCIESQAILRDGMFGKVLVTDLQEWTIARWDAVELSTAPVDFTCARYTLRVNLVQKSATKVRSTISNAAECSHQQKADLTLTLADGPREAGRTAEERLRIAFPARLTPRAAAFLNSRVPQPRPD